MIDFPGESWWLYLCEEKHLKEKAKNNLQYWSKGLKCRLTVRDALPVKQTYEKTILGWKTDIILTANFPFQPFSNLTNYYILLTRSSDCPSWWWKCYVPSPLHCLIRENPNYPPPLFQLFTRQTKNKTHFLFLTNASVCKTPQIWL
jgi:hypothetical protein